MPSTVTIMPGEPGRPDLVARRWAATGEPWAHVLVVHGLGEHSGRYEHVGDAMAEVGLEVHAYDQRGFGASGGPKAYVDEWRDVHDDLEGQLARVRAGAGDTPVVLYGHSLGGLIVLGFVLQGRSMPDLLVLSTPALDDYLPRWRHRLAPALDRYLGRIRFPNRIRPAALARTPRQGFDYGERDPLVQRSTTVHFGALAFEAQAAAVEALKQLDHLPVPTLVVQGSDDPLVPLSATARLERFPEVTRIVYPGYRHEIHNESDSPVVADTVAWLRSQLMGGERGREAMRARVALSATLPGEYT
jgi:alpha-beta hydrolase superfamily lysophospholipase